jgi:enamine deaminase RidA (YjgF/YER057c/UK114 family)
MKIILPLLFISFFTLHGFGQSNQIIKKKFHDGKFNQQDTTAGYAEAILVDNTLYISGWIGRGTIAEQLQEIYTSLGNILKAYGATYQNVVKETLFTTDIEAVKNNNAVRKAFYKGDFPAATWIQITRLFSARPDAQIEVELIAHLPKSITKEK